MVDILSSKTWVKYRKGMCDGCFAGCCTLPVLVTSEDLFHMGYLRYEEVNGDLTKIFLRLKKRGILKRLNLKNATFVLESKKNHDCIFLTKDRFCRIYDRRPTVCRAFPKNSVRPGFCPCLPKS